MFGSLPDNDQTETPQDESDSSSTPLYKRLSPIPVAGELKRRARFQARKVVRRNVPGGARHAFRMDLSASLLAGFYTGAVFPFVMIIARDDLKANGSVLALITAAPFVGNGLALFLARAMEGRPKLPFVKWTQLIARFIITLALIARGAWAFAFVIAGAQIIGTIATPAYVAVIKEVYPAEQRGRLLSLTKAAALAAMVAGTLLAGWLMAHFKGHIDYKVVFAVAGILGMCAALIFARIIPNEEVAPGDEAPKLSLWGNVVATRDFVRDTLGILNEDQAYRWFAFSVFTYGFGNLMTVPLIPMIQVDELHIRKEEIAVLANLTQVLAVVGYFYWGRYVDRHSPQRAVVVNVLLNTTVPLVYILTAFIPGVNAWTLLPAFAISGIVGAGIDLSYFNAVLTFSGPDNVSRYQALQSFLLGIRGTIAPFVGSFMAATLREHHLNLRWAFVAGMACMLVGAWMQGEAMKRQSAMQELRDRG